MSETNSESSRSSLTQGAEVTVNLEGLDSVPAQFVNYFTVNHDGAMFQLYFSQVLPPPITDEATFERIKSTGIRGHAVARLVVTPEIAEAILKALTQNVETMAQLRGAKGDETDR